MQTGNPVRQALLGRKPAFGTWIQIGHPAVAEILAGVGFDWLAADCEHADIDAAAFANLARGMHGRGPVPLARVRCNEPMAIRLMLDMGARGIIVPMVNTAAEAERAVRSAKYPPRGIRGYCFSRMNDYGTDFDNYAATANDDIAVVAMIETAEAVRNVEAILATDGIDGVFVGPYDLSGSFGIPGRTAAAQVSEACSRLRAAAAAAGKSAGLHVVIPTAEAVEKAVEDGYTFIAVGIDTLFLREQARQSLTALRALAS